MSDLSPHDIYRARLHARQASHARLVTWNAWIANLRGAVGILCGVFVWLIFSRGLFGPVWLAVPAISFVILVVAHDRVIWREAQAARAIAYYVRALSRLDGKWMGTGASGAAFLDPQHPYAADLDLFGEGSLFQLLSMARTPSGEEVLARWLLGPAPIDEVRARQVAVEELRVRVDLREELFLVGEEVRTQFRPETLVAWGTAPPLLPPAWIRPLLFLLATCSASAFAWWLVFSRSALPALAMTLLVGAVHRLLAPKVLAVSAAVLEPRQQLALFAAILERLEAEPMEAPRLRAIKEAIAADGTPASQEIKRLVKLVDRLQAAQNQFFAPIAFLLLWRAQFAFAIETWRLRAGPRLFAWLEAVGTLEALASLSGYAFERPTLPFPALREAKEPYFEGNALVHPLLPGCVANDFVLGGELRLVLLSGSNMSGKSTFLRTIGCNVVMALMGGPVPAAKLELSVLQVGASLRVQDSLQTGTSHFFAEIKRIRQLVELADGKPPLLFLVDEILHGTNSHDRKAGAEGILRGLVRRGAIGITTTHDLALAEVVTALGSQAENAHFEDTLSDGKLHFDYTLRRGLVTKSNAIELMRTVGLEV